MSWKVCALASALLIALISGARLTQDPDAGTASWDATRAAGFAGYLLLWASVTAGVALHMRWRPGSAALTWILETHRITSTLALAFMLGHIWGLLIDPVIRFQPWDVAVPLFSDYRPVQVALGILALWLTAAVLATTAFAARMPYRWWRLSHYLAFPAYALALLHGITAGTDSGDVRAVSLYAGTAAVLVGMLVWRLAGRGWTTAIAPAVPNRES